MRTFAALLGLTALVSLLALCGCDSGAPPAPAPESPQAPPAQEEEPESPDAGEPAEEEAVPEDEDSSQGSRLWPDHPRAREILIDPHDESQNCSYWRDAKVGDWVRFLNHRKNVIIWKVIKRDGDKLEFTSIEYKPNGEEIPEKKLDIREHDIKEDDKEKRSSLLNNPYIRRYVHEWKLFNSDKVLLCEHHFVPNPMTGEDNENLSCREIRCGGFVKKRRGKKAVVTLIDYGDAEHPPKWDHLKPAELLNYWYINARFLHESLVLQDDDPRGEPPEMPEDLPPADLTEKLTEMDKLLGPEFSKALEEKRFKDTLGSLERVGAVVADVRAYAGKHNYSPAMAQVEKVSARAAELRKACDKKDADKAARALSEVRGMLDWLYLSVGYKKEEK